MSPPDAIKLRFIAVSVLLVGMIWLGVPLQRKLGGGWAEGAAVGFPFVGYVILAGAAVISYYGVRAWMQRRLIRHPVYTGEGMRFASAAWDMVFMLCFGLTYMAACLLWYSIDRELIGLQPEWGVLLAIGAVAFAAAFVLIRDVSSRLFRDLTKLQGRLDALARSSPGRGELGSRLPLPSTYESGELAAAFNTLLRRFERQYDRLEQDLELAFHVQEQLLSHQISEWQGWTMTTTRSRPDRVGGGFHDAWPVSERRLAIAAGSVEGKELPAALVMSAVMMMFRTRMDQEADAGAWLTGLSDALADVMGDDLRIHIAVALLDLDRGEVCYAIAGDMRVRVSSEAHSVHSVHSGAASNAASPGDALEPSPIGNHDSRPPYPTRIAKLPAGPCRVELFADGNSVYCEHGGIVACQHGGESK